MTRLDGPQGSSNNSEEWKVTPLIATLAGQWTRGQNDFFFYYNNKIRHWDKKHWQKFVYHFLNKILDQNVGLHFNWEISHKGGCGVLLYQIKYPTTKVGKVFVFQPPSRSHQLPWRGMEFMIFTKASLQGIFKTFWIHHQGALMSLVFLITVYISNFNFNLKNGYQAQNKPHFKGRL